MGRRIDIQADDICELLGEGGNIGELEVPPAVQAEAMALPDRLDRRLRDPATFAIARGVQWVASCGGACWVRRTGPVAKQAVDTLVHEPLLPAPDKGLGLAGLGHDRRASEPLVALQDDPRPPDMFLRAFQVRDDRL